MPLVFLICGALCFAEGFHCSPRQKQGPCRSIASLSQHTFGLRMGLYDTPLPPRPPPREDPKQRGKNQANEEDEDEVVEETVLRLFQFDVKGKEVNDLLPSLSRRLDKGVDCYYEATDRLVQNLVGKTSCSAEDTCWALEACKGDITEAWTRISVARRTQLNAARFPIANEEDDYDDEWDEDSYEVEMEEEYERLKASRLAKDKRNQIEDTFRGGTPDQPWLPKANPNPVDDEPWFTG
jgi:hypothetical protein